MNADRIYDVYYGEQSSMTTLRARERIHWICKQVNGEKVLDIGCSQGIVCLILGREGFECTGIDIEPGAIEFARQEVQKQDEVVQRRVRYEIADGTQLPYEDASFDTVILSEILEHLIHPEKVLEEARRVLKDKGTLLVTVPYGLNAFPDHKQTFYPISFMEQVQPFFRTMTIETVNRYIAYRGMKDSSYDFSEVSKGALFLDYLRLEKDLEKQFLANELSFLETRIRLQNQLSVYKKQIDVLKQRIREHAERIKRKELEIKEHVIQIEVLEKQVNEAQQVVTTKDQAFRDSLSLRETEWQEMLNTVEQRHERELERGARMLSEVHETYTKQLTGLTKEFQSLAALNAKQIHDAVMDKEKEWESKVSEIEQRYEVALANKTREYAELRAQVEHEWQAKLSSQEQVFSTQLSELENQHQAALAAEIQKTREAQAQQEVLAATSARREQEWQLHVSTREQEFNARLEELEQESVAKLAAATKAIQELQLTSAKRMQLQARTERAAQARHELSPSERIRQIAATVVPLASTILVISKGDDELLDLDDRTGWHFPQNAEGVYAGHHPATSTEAIAHLEELRGKGAGYLLIPSSAFWWLDHYAEFRAHLAREYRLILYCEESCLIYALQDVISESSMWLDLRLAQSDLSRNGHSTERISPPRSTGSLANRKSASQNSYGRTNGSSPNATASTYVPSSAVAVQPGSGAQATSQSDQVNLAAILDEFTTECFRPECNLITFRPDNWKDKLDSESPHAIFVESAWRGNEGSWQYRVAKYERNMGDELLDLLAWAKARRIPSIFWNKEDPVHFERFIERAAAFDYVFTTDANCISDYRQHLQHDRVFALPFAAQPAIHNPMLEQPRAGSVCFAGTYYGDRHAQRRNDLEHILKPARAFGLDIYDRQYGVTGKQAELFKFPEIYQGFIRGRLQYDEMVKAYKSYRVFLNVNSVTDSPTMFSRRVFELLACGTPVISSYSKGIVELLGEDVVFLSDSEAETQRHLETLLGDDEAWMRASVKGIRKVMEDHTYAERLAQMLARVDVPFKGNPSPAFTVISAVKPDVDLGEWATMLRKQSYQHFDLILLSESPLVQDQLTRLRNQLAGISIANMTWSSQGLYQQCREFSYAAHFAIMDTRDYYGPDYLKDHALAIAYANAAFAGKHSYFRAQENGKKLCSPGYDFQYVASVPTATLVARKDALSESELLRCFRSRVFRSEQRVLSLDRFGYLQHGSGQGKTPTMDGKVREHVEV